MKPTALTEKSPDLFERRTISFKFTAPPLSQGLKDSITAARDELKATLESVRLVFDDHHALEASILELESKIDPTERTALIEELEKAGASIPARPSGDQDGNAYQRANERVQEAERALKAYMRGPGLDTEANRPALLSQLRMLSKFYGESEAAYAAGINSLRTAVEGACSIIQAAAIQPAHEVLNRAIITALEPFFVAPGAALSIANSSPLHRALSLRYTLHAIASKESAPFQRLAVAALKDSEELLAGSHSFEVSVKDPRPVPTSDDLAEAARMEEANTRANEAIKSSQREARKKDLRDALRMSGIDPESPDAVAAIAEA